MSAPATIRLILLPLSGLPLFSVLAGLLLRRART
jgi:hypothetical protein